MQQIEWTDEQVSRYWDYLSLFPEHYFTYQFGHIIFERLGKYLSGRKTVLDYGCGTGFIIPHLLKRKFLVSGLDFSKKSVEQVNKRFKKDTHFRGAFLLDEMLKRGERFDAILVIEVIEHLKDEHLDAMATALKKLLKPNGIVIFTTPNEEELSLSEIICPDCEKTFHRWQHVRRWSRGELMRYLSEKSFSVVKCGITDFSASFRIPSLNTAKYAVKRFLRRKPPHLFCVATIRS